MKKFWKNLCTYSLAVTCGVAVAGCGGNNDGNISRDLDGDGVISSWETVFTSEGASHRVIPTEEYVAINSVNDLLAINDNITFNSNKTYKLMRNIDCGGREISIDLFGAKFYGNNKIISNFKLGKVNFLTDPVEEGEREVISGVPETKALFYNGYAVYDLKVFMGNQKYVLEDSMSSSVYSPFVNIGEIDGVEVKGNIDITKNSKEDRGAHNELKASLLYSPVNIESEGITIPKSVSIKDCSVDGKISLNDTSNNLESFIGGMASVLPAEATLYNSYASVDIYDSSNNVTHVGGLVGKNNGFISTCVSTGEMKFSYWGGVQLENIGGVVGYSSEYSEIKNCSTNMSISSAIPEDLQAVPNQSSNYPINIGGIVGRSESSILNYVQSDAVININNPHKGIMFTVGGLCGENIKGDVQNVICRGSINAVNPYYINVANMSGRSVYGSIRSAVVTTDINVDTHAIEGSTVKMGSLIIFENFSSDNDLENEYTATVAPYLKGVLVGGKDTALLGNGKFEYALGLRNSFAYLYDDGQTGEGEENEPVYIERFPAVMEQVYISNHMISTNYDETNSAYHQSTELKELLPKFSSKITIREEDIDNPDTSFKVYTKFMISELGFKPYLNHNELVADANSTFDTLSFNVPVEKQLIKFHEEKKYNGELVYFDRLFGIDDKGDRVSSENHIGNDMGDCEYDTKDKLFSFFNYLLTKNINNENFSLRFADTYFNVNRNNDPEIDTGSDTLEDRIEFFRDLITRTLGCMGVNVQKSELITDANKILDPEADESIEGNVIRYLKLTINSKEFAGTRVWLFDISDLQLTNSEGECDYNSANKKEFYDFRLILNPKQ